MALLGRADIDRADDIRHEDVPVPEWGGTVRVRGMTGAQRSLVEATMVASKGQSVEIRVDALKTLRERTVATALVDADGNRLYGDKEVAQLGAKNAEVIQRLFAKAQELSGTSKDAVAEKESKSEAAPSGGSDSTSP